MLSAGDNIGATSFESAHGNDEPTVRYLNALGLQASAAGMHEFDRGAADLTGRVQPLAGFSYLGANVYQPGSQTPALPEFKILTAGGFRVGVIGVVVPEREGPGAPTEVEYGDPVDAANRVADRLTDGNRFNGEADVLVMLIHGGASTSASLSEAVSQSSVFKRIVESTTHKVSAIVGGKTHRQYAFDAPMPNGDGTRPVVQASSYGRDIATVRLGYDSATHRLVQYNSATVEAVAPASGAACLSNTEYQAARSVASQAISAARTAGGPVVGNVSADITTAFMAGRRDDRSGESALGNMVAGAFRDRLNQPGRPGADIGVVHAGALNDDFLAAPRDTEATGQITRAELWSLFPSRMTGKVVTLTGAQFKTLLEQQWQPATSFPVQRLGLSDNVSYTYDPYKPAGSRVGTVTIGGFTMNPAGTYRVAGPSFLLDGATGFPVLGQGTNKADSGIPDHQLLSEWLGAHNPVAPSFTKRSTAVINQPATLGVQPVTVRVEDLDMTSLGAPNTTTVSVGFDDDYYYEGIPAQPAIVAGPAPARKGLADVRLWLPLGYGSGPHAAGVMSSPTSSVARFTYTSTGSPVGPGQVPYRLGSGATVYSPNRACGLVMQADGNLVIYGPSGAMWSSGTYAPGAYLDHQGDGNLVIYEQNRDVVWSNLVMNGDQVILTLQDDCNLVAQKRSQPGAITWDSMGAVNGSHTPARKIIRGLASGQSAFSYHLGSYELRMQSDGNLVIYAPGGVSRWSTGTNVAGSYLTAQSDGNLVLRAPSGVPVWHTNTGGRDTVTFLGNDGVLAVYDRNTRALLWSSAPTNAVMRQAPAKPLETWEITPQPRIPDLHP